MIPMACVPADAFDAFQEKEPAKIQGARRFPQGQGR